MLRETIEKKKEFAGRETKPKLRKMWGFDHT